MKKRTYCPTRGKAPAIGEILALREARFPFSAIAERYGVHRRTIYLALDRAADHCELAPADASRLHPDDPDCRSRLRIRIYAALEAAADRGDLAPERAMKLYADDPDARRAVCRRIETAFRSGVAIVGWDETLTQAYRQFLAEQAAARAVGAG